MAIDKEFGVSVGQQSASTGKLMDNSEWKYHIKQRLYDVREMIDNHIEHIHTSVTDNVKQSIKYIQNVQKTIGNGNTKKILGRPNGGQQTLKLDPSMFAIRRLWDQVASPEESREKDFNVAINKRPVGSHSQLISVKQIKEMHQMQRKKTEPRITKGEKEELMATRLTKGEQINTNSTSTSEEVIRIETQVDRFKRQGASGSKTVSAHHSIIWIFLFHTNIFHTCSCVNYIS